MTRSAIPRTVLVLGGTRSGKSEFAERLTASLQAPTVYLATSIPSDPEMADRVQRHQRRRPQEWVTLEAPRDIGSTLQAQGGDVRTVLLDSVTLWVSNLMMRVEPGRDPVPASPDEAEYAICQELELLWTTQAQMGLSLVLVSDEVGMGLVPDYASGRLFRDLLGTANQWLAARCDAVYLVVAGLALDCRSLAVAWPPAWHDDEEPLA